MSLQELLVLRDAEDVMRHLAAEEARYLSCTGGHQKLINELFIVIALDALNAYDSTCMTASRVAALEQASYSAPAQASCITKMILGKEADLRQVMRKASLDDLLAIAYTITGGPRPDASIRSEAAARIRTFMDDPECWFSTEERSHAENLLAGKKQMDQHACLAVEISMAAVHLSWRASQAADCIRHRCDPASLASQPSFQPFTPMVREFYRTGSIQEENAASGYAYAVFEMLKDFLKI